MPPTTVRTYQEAEGNIPLNQWLQAIGADSHAAATRCRDVIGRLADSGHALRRPSTAPLRDGVYELRARVGKVNYRILYFFDGSGVAVLALGCTKEGEVDDADIDRAISYRTKYLANRTRHTVPSARPPAPAPPSTKNR
jgi:hypothetical protein